MNNSLNQIIFNQIIPRLAQSTPEECASVLDLLEGRAKLESKVQNSEPVWNPGRLFTYNELVKMTRLSRMTIRRQVDDGKLKAYSPTGGRILFKEADVKAWWDQYASTPINTEGGAA